MKYILYFPDIEKVTQEDNNKMNTIMQRLERYYSLTIEKLPLNLILYSAFSGCLKFRVMLEEKDTPNKGKKYSEMLKDVCVNQEERDLLGKYFCLYTENGKSEPVESDKEKKPKGNRIPMERYFSEVLAA